MTKRNIAVFTASVVSVMVAFWYLAYKTIDAGHREATVSSIARFVDEDVRTRYLETYASDIVDAFHDDGESYETVRQRVFSMLITNSDPMKSANAAALMFVAIKHRENKTR